MEPTRLISETLYDDLLESIQTGLWRVGEKIPSENQIAKEKNISRSSVRTAIHKLQARGVIETKPGKGSFVLSAEEPISNSDLHMELLDLSANDYRHMVELRRALEFTSIEVLCNVGTNADFERLDLALEAMEKATDASSYIQADFEFHYAIILGSHNPVFIRIYDLCKDILFKYFSELYADNRDNNVVNAKGNHREMVKYMKQRNARKTIEIIESTFEYNHKRLSKYFKDEDSILN
ncbi:MAG: FadR/GntR family transcriptional regulator [Sphaerochaetaceae bacterium]|jgi:GntR family transcriptional activator of glc operon